jgi:hypothetical protein
MSRKKFNPDDLDETVGPMNHVAKEDAMVWAGVKNPDNMNEYEKRTVVVKKQNIKKSTVKNERRLSKNIIKNLDDSNNDRK